MKNIALTTLLVLLIVSVLFNTVLSTALSIERQRDKDFQAMPCGDR